ncbi:TPA: saccharopine dehydrogenase NADP-binding domain-containing protein, partial [Streptococcus equi subsp. equi]|nr:saccharopine dehydrogenase NADP-binding domain-containing protein [Streptococcus equi subsp. equi]
MYNIGVLGCNGNIGSLFMEKVSKWEDNYIYAVSRSHMNFIKKDNIEYIFFDAENIEKLDKFCSKCDVIVNCTGIDKTNIMNICLKNDVNYVDPSFVDTDIMSKKLMETNDNCIICSAGCNPGLTEVLAKYISIKFNPKICEIIFSGNGSMSKSAINELLDLSGEYRSNFRSFIKFKSIEKLEYWDLKRKLNDSYGDVICMPVINKSFLRCINSTGIDMAYFYNTFKSEKIISKLIEAKCMLMKDVKTYETVVANLGELF